MNTDDRKALLLTRIAAERVQLGRDLQHLRSASMPSRWLPGALRQWAFGAWRPPGRNTGGATFGAGSFGPTASHLTDLILQAMGLVRRHRATLSLAGSALAWLGRRKRWGGLLLLAGAGAAAAAWWATAPHAVRPGERDDRTG